MVTYGIADIAKHHFPRAYKVVASFGFSFADFNK
jgi:hypothetical protein